MAVEQAPPTVHRPLQAKALFPTMIKPEAKNMPPPGVDY